MIAILSYHSISPSTYPYAVSAEMFERQLLWLKRSFTVLSAADFPRALSDHRGKKYALITFDDGFKDVVTTALPIMQRHGVPGVLFLSPGLVGGTFCDLPMMEWDEVKKLQTSGFFAIESHAVTHRKLKDLPLDEMCRELIDSQRMIEEKTAASVRWIAYPYGSYTPAVAEEAARQYRYGFAIDGIIDDDSRIEPLLLPRIIVSRDMSMMKFKLRFSPWFWRVRKWLKR